MEVGIDCVEISEFKEIANDKMLLQKIFTENEIRYCLDRVPSSQHFAARFAAKEAIIKALYPYKIQLPLNQIEISNDANGCPYAQISTVENANLEIKISLSHSKELAMAVAIVFDKGIVDVFAV